MNNSRGNILVTGGLGFIGSHTVVCLYEAGYTPIVVDNLNNSRIEVLGALSELIGYTPKFYAVDVLDQESMAGVIRENAVSAVIHFAAYKAVGESVEQPLMYYRNNVGGLISLLEVMKAEGLDKLVFSSSCTVYGEPKEIPVKEGTETRPAASPYGATKQMGEVILRDNTWCNVQCLRYFNPVGAHDSGKIGELPLGVPNNLIPYLTQTVAGIRSQLTVHGGDYDTPDGSCIRDYIHVMDLADAHVAAVARLFAKSKGGLSGYGVDGVQGFDNSNAQFELFNIGTGNGFSVLEVISAFEGATGKKVPFVVGPRRAGDVVAVWADTQKVNEVLGWKATRNLDMMMRDAWRWQESCR